MKKGVRNKFVFILIFIVVVLAGIIIYNSLISKQIQENFELENKEEVKITKAILVDGNLRVNLQKNYVDEYLVGVYFSLNNEENSIIVRKNISAQDGNETFNFSLEKLNLTNVTFISFALIHINNFGKEKLSNFVVFDEIKILGVMETVSTITGSAVPFVVSPFLTNVKPLVSEVSFSGTTFVYENLSGSYTYSDSEGDVEGTSTFQWYRSDNETGANKTAISDATEINYVLQPEDKSKFLSFEVVPVQTGGSSGTVNTSNYSESISGPPAMEDIVQWFNGEYYLSGGVYYLRDKSGNGYDAEIVDFDWDENWTTRGFSYNSVAMIKQPSTGGDYDAFYPEDNRKFWYGSANTPREIPVISLSQDIHYANKIFTRHINSTSINDRGYIKDIITYDSSLTGSNLTEAQTYFEIPAEEITNVVWVTYWGSNSTGNGSKSKPYRTYAKAIEEASGGDTIYAGFVWDLNPVLNEEFNLTAKTLKIIGTGYSIISSNNNANENSSLNISTNSEFEHLIIDRKRNSNSVFANIITITDGSPNFTLCNIGYNKNTYYRSRYPMDISNSANVTMTDCSIRAGVGDEYDYVDLHNSSKLDFIGGFIKGSFRLYDSSYVNVNMDRYMVGQTALRPTQLYNSSIGIFNIRTRAALYNISHMEVLGDVSASLFKGYDNSTLTLSGNELGGYISFDRGSAIINLENIITTFGRTWVAAREDLNVNSVVNIDNVSSIFDLDDDTTGSHNLETFTNEIMKWNINNSRFEFSGHQGRWDTMGNPLSFAYSNVTIENSVIIDNVDDCVPFGQNYRHILVGHGLLTLRNVTLKNQNWDGTCINRVMSINKYEDVNITVTLENVIFESDINHNDAVAIYINRVSGTAITDDDWICATNLTDNTLASTFSKSSHGAGIDDYNTLIANCPN
jgi:hypothetical protein